MEGSPLATDVHDGGGPAVVSPVVAVTTLEVLQSRDLPDEILEDEDVQATLPRRLGLSDVVDTQIRRYREAKRRRRRLPESEVLSLFRLVSRRPDARELFRQVGRRLAGEEEAAEEGSGGIWRFLPDAVGRFVARRRLRSMVAGLLGHRELEVERDPDGLRGRGFLLVRTEPPGEACALVTGLASALFRRYCGHAVRVSHPECEARGDAGCRWVAEG